MTQHLFKRIANWGGLMTRFTRCLATITRLHVWRWPKQQPTRRFVSVRIWVKYTSRALDIFIAHTAIMTVLWLNWKMLAGRYLMTLAYSSSRVTSSAVRGAGKNPHVTWSEQSSLIRATFSYLARSFSVTTIFAAMLTKKPYWIACWLSSRTTYRRKWRALGEN